jgi:hypothetical protein
LYICCGSAAVMLIKLIMVCVLVWMCVWMLVCMPMDIFLFIVLMIDCSYPCVLIVTGIYYIFLMFFLVVIESLYIKVVNYFPFKNWSAGLVFITLLGVGEVVGSNPTSCDTFFSYLLI